MTNQLVSITHKASLENYNFEVIEFCWAIGLYNKMPTTSINTTMFGYAISEAKVVDNFTSYYHPNVKVFPFSRLHETPIYCKRCLNNKPWHMRIHGCL